MTPLALALLFVMLPIIWVVVGLLVAAITSHLIKGGSAMKRLPKIFAVIIGWPFWVIYLSYEK